VNQDWKESADIAERLTGIRPPKVEGKFWPIKADPKLAEQAAERQAKQNVFERASGNAFVSFGSTKARTGGTDAVNLDVMKVLMGYIDDQTTYNALAIPARDVNKLIRNPEFKKALTETYNESIYNQFPRWLKDQTNPRRIDSTAEMVANVMRRNATKAQLGLKVSVSAMQAGSITQTANEIGVKSTARGLVEFYKNPKKAVQFVNDKSVQMKHSDESVSRNIKDVMRSNRVKRMIKGKPGGGELAFALIHTVDKGTRYPSWIGAYNKELARTGNDSDAVKFADKVVRKTQPRGDTKDLAAISRGNEFQKLFTSYYGHFSNAYNLLAGTKDFVKLSDASKFEKATKMARGFVYLVAIPALYSAWARKGFKKLTLKEMAEAIGLYLTGTMPFVRDVFSPYGVSAVPAAKGPQELNRLRGRIKTKGLWSKKVSLETRWYGGGGALAGLPSEQAWISGTGAYELLNGDTDDFRRLGFSEFALREDESSDKSKKKK